MLLSIDVTSFAIGAGCGFLLYLCAAVSLAFWVSKKWERESNYNADLYEKKLREAGYCEDIWE